MPNYCKEHDRDLVETQGQCPECEAEALKAPKAFKPEHCALCTWPLVDEACDNPICVARSEESSLGQIVATG